ncbi:MAG: hypothetical protein ABSG43_13305 [Solirubrobacteraceae bacterium]|jgi:hypothetical protein
MSHTTTTTDADPFVAPNEPRRVLDQIREGGLPALVSVAKADKPLAYAAASTVALLIAGLGPQANTTSSVSVGPIAVGQVTTHSAIPGWTFVLLALIAGTGLVLSLRSNDHSWLRLTRVAAGVSIAASFITYLQIIAQSALGLGGVGWGFVIGLAAGCILAISTRILAHRTAQPT